MRRMFLFVTLLVLLAASNAAAQATPPTPGPSEALAISLRLRRETPPRPLTHDLLEKVIRARNQALTATGVQGTAAAEGALTGALRSLFAVVEAYPQLKANENVARLQEELTSTENRIAFARQFYNDLVMRLNTRIQVVPTNLVATLFGFKEEAYFEIPVAEQEPVKVDLR